MIKSSLQGLGLLSMGFYESIKGAPLRFNFICDNLTPLAVDFLYECFGEGNGQK